MKQRKRKLTTAIRHERLMTGGGPAPVQPNDPVIAFMDATNANIDIEIDCAFDSTAVYEKEYNVKMDSTKRKLIIEDENKEEEDNIDAVIYDQNIPPTFRSTPLEKRATSNIRNIQSIRDEKELKLIKIREAIEQQRELHAKRMKIAEAEEKIVLLKLLKEEDALRQM
ncbi:hypothetical protein RF55_13313 [Lasius niger]|uniref:Uncharacterized protein n=1 Tax=Lasius niger TaxID=67767 RepID=A0A0J7KAX1_LASNI|nr:hypothetical protein RF55_13313 [Lasius niger]